LVIASKQDALTVDLTHTETATKQRKYERFFVRPASYRRVDVRDRKCVSAQRPGNDASRWKHQPVYDDER
jgi:hypothetical protein